MESTIFNISPLLLVILVAFLDSTMDKIRTRYDITIWSRLSNGSKDWWFNPSVSWYNKYWYMIKKYPNVVKILLHFIFTTVLVWITDFWHFLKFIKLNLIFIWVIILTFGNFSLILLLVFWLFWGLVFEMNFKLKWNKE